MITWIQRTFQRHFKIVFILMLLIVGIPMVVVFSPSSGIGQASHQTLEQKFFGVNLNNPAEARQISLDANLSAQLKAGYNALEGAQAQQYTLQRIAGLALADDLHLPPPSADQISKYITTLRAFQDQQTGQFDQKKYTSFSDQLKGNPQVTIADVNRVLRDDTRLEILSKLIGGPGYVAANDVQQQLTRADTTWTVQVATLEYAAFNPTIAPNEETLIKFHEENAFRYDVPARPRFSYIEFKGANFMPPVPPTEAELRAIYSANPAAFPVPADADKKETPVLNPAVPVDNFPKVRAQIESQLKQFAASKLSSNAANDLTLALYERKLTANSAELAAFLASQRLTSVGVAPFSPDNPPADKAWLGNYADQIARLSQERFFSDPLPTSDSFVVLLWNEALPAYKPLFTQIRDRVLADYKSDTKRKLFSERGKTLRAQLNTAAAKSPAAFAETAAAEKLTVKSPAAFTLRQPPSDLPYQAFSALQTLEVGQVSEMAATAEQGVFVYAQAKKQPDLTPGSPRYAEVEKQLRQYTAGTNENAYLRELIEQELKKSAPATRAN